MSRRILGVRRVVYLMKHLSLFLQAIADCASCRILISLVSQFILHPMDCQLIHILFFALHGLLLRCSFIINMGTWVRSITKHFILQSTRFDVLVCKWPAAMGWIALQTVHAFGAGNDVDSCLSGSIDDLGLCRYDLFLKLLLWSQLKHPILSLMHLIVIALCGAVQIDHWRDISKHPIWFSDILTFMPTFLSGHDAIVFANLWVILRLDVFYDVRGPPV